MSPSPFRLDGKTVLISGAGGGIGQSLVAAFRAAGASVVGADRDAAMLQDRELSAQLLFDQADAKRNAPIRRQGIGDADRDGQMSERVSQGLDEATHGSTYFICK